MLILGKKKSYRKRNALRIRLWNYFVFRKHFKIINGTQLYKRSNFISTLKWGKIAVCKYMFKQKIFTWSLHDSFHGLPREKSDCISPSWIRYRKKWSALQAEIVLIWSKTQVWETWSHVFLVTVMYNLNIQTDKSFCDLKSLFNFIKGECALWLVSYIAADSQCFNSQGNPNNCKQLNN